MILSQHLLLRIRVQIIIFSRKDWGFFQVFVCFLWKCLKFYKFVKLFKIFDASSITSNNIILWSELLSLFYKSFFKTVRSTLLKGRKLRKILHFGSSQARLSIDITFGCTYPRANESVHTYFGCGKDLLESAIKWLFALRQIEIFFR